MRFTLTTLAVVLFALSGCVRDVYKGDEEAGGFRVLASQMEVPIRQGETEKIALKLERDKGYDRDVTISIHTPAGISAVPMQVTRTKDDGNEIEVALTAAPNARPSVQQIEIKGSSRVTSAKPFTVTIQVPVRIVPRDSGS